MRNALVLTPTGRAGYAGSAHLDARRRGEKAMLVEGRTEAECFERTIRWLDWVDVLAVYDDLVVNDTMLNVIAVAEEIGIPVEFRQVPADRISIIDRAANAA